MEEEEKRIRFVDSVSPGDRLHHYRGLCNETRCTPCQRWQVSRVVYFTSLRGRQRDPWWLSGACHSWRSFPRRSTDFVCGGWAPAIRWNSDFACSWNFFACSSSNLCRCCCLFVSSSKWFGYRLVCDVTQTLPAAVCPSCRSRFQVILQWSVR